jgi:hypothetical protein
MMKTATSLQSHFVMPREADGFWIGDRRIEFKEAAAATFPLKPGEALVLRKGAAAVGVRVVWACGVGGKDAPAALAWDGNKYGVVRLTVTHYDGKELLPPVAGAGAALWVRVGGGLAGDEAFHAWRKAFAEARATADVAARGLRLTAVGTSGMLSIEVGYPDGGPPSLFPPPARAVLELDGDDIGRKLLADTEPVKSPLIGPKP